jgi:hypothetical protein
MINLIDLWVEEVKNKGEEIRVDQEKIRIGDCIKLWNKRNIRLAMDGDKKEAVLNKEN